MTDLNLICEEPYMIGLIGGISFLSFSIGSILVTRRMDGGGRRKILIMSSSATILGCLLMLAFANGMMLIFTIIFGMGLVYNARCSSSYVFCSEYLPKQHHHFLLRSVFQIQGVIQAATVIFFYYFKSQQYYVTMLVILELFAQCWVMYGCDESPHYLYEKWQVREAALLFQSGCQD